MIKKTYPNWLNNVSILILMLFPIAAGFLIAGIFYLGLTILIAGFSLLWIFGEVAARV